ncbi:MAG: AMP-binding protein [Phycisphaerales bacterium]|nr:AMP-binding protein [Phycisphaerales bacterium]
MNERLFFSRESLRDQQLDSLCGLIEKIKDTNPFWRARLRAAGVDENIESLEAFAARLPLLTKADLAADQEAHPPYGTNLTTSIDAYVRVHQTSSTTGNPLRWLDTEDNWHWLLAGWDTVLDVADVTEFDCLFFAFSFGPFIGFWMAWDAALDLGCRCISGGAMNTATRVRAIIANEVTVLLCTPTYAIRLGESAREQGIDFSSAKVRRIIVAGEPGGSVPAVRSRIEQLWPTARVFDHHGMTEVGPVTFECPRRPCVLHVDEGRYLCEIIDPATGRPLPAEDGATGEMVITALGREDSPVLRYRTGDMVRCETSGACLCGRLTMRLIGGIIGRVDDMVVVRGTNLYPSALDALLGPFTEVVEYRAEIGKHAGMTELTLIIEPAPEVAEPGGLCRRVEQAIRDAWNLRVPVRAAPPGELPRFELKARRWVRLEE